MFTLKFQQMDAYECLKNIIICVTVAMVTRRMPCVKQVVIVPGVLHLIISRHNQNL